MRSRDGLTSAMERTAAVVSSVIASAVLARGLEPYIAVQALLLPFTLAVIVSAWYGGLAAGIGATVLSFLIADYLFIDPRFQFHTFSATHGVLFGLFLVVGVSISVLKTALARQTKALTTTIEKLDQVTQRYELAAQHGRIGFQDYHAASGQQIWTSEMEQLFGIAPGRFEGTYEKWLQRVHPEDRERVAQQRRLCIERRQTDWQYEYRAVLPDGKVRWLEGRSRLFFSPSGSLLRILGATIDITERRGLEQSLRERSEQLVTANQELERFAYVVSHDLQEPLRGIAAMAELSLHRNRQSMAPESLAPLEFVVKNAHRMAWLVRDILDLARAGTGSVDATTEVSIAAVVQTAMEELKRQIEESHARITVDPMPTIRANQGQLERLFRNLLSNAVKYRGANRPEIHVSAMQHGEEWIFCVSDNGIGIEPQYHEQIFGAFHRLHARSEYEGTGLGLAICRRIVERHSGRMWLESEPQKGCKFYIALPQSGSAMQTIQRGISATG